MTSDLFCPPSLEEIETLHGPLPQPGRVLTPEEQVQAAARPPPKPRYYRKAERWARDRLVILLDAELNKNTDELKSYEKDGEIKRYRTCDGLDYSGRMLLQWNGEVHATPIEMEVKAFQDSFPTGTLERQYNMLDEARRHALTMVCLVQHNQGTVLRGFYIPWRRPGDPRRGTVLRHVMDYADVIEALQARACGNYKGKSIRPQDQDLLAEHLVQKVNGRWQLCPWLEQLQPNKAQGLLF